ncbi:glycosyltransferase family 9 protein [Croceimicrobium sp.]|uniref:glycosyltransferase family 9 protein n=1 Tax=Croceimicrobium sp. TaxID=2828340 RepID=UPI003BA975B4
MRILVQRFSALGDIMILLPILQQLKAEHPEHEIALLSRPFIGTLCQDLGLQFYGAQLQKEHKGLIGLKRLVKEVNRDFKPDLLIDAHSVLRTKIISKFFALKGVPSESLHKDRQARKAFLESSTPSQAALTPVSQLHLETFARQKIEISFDRAKIKSAPYTLNGEHEEWWTSRKAEINIGIAPGARHKSKEWPREKFIALMKDLERPERKFFLFGGPDEVEVLTELAKAAAVSFEIVAGKLKLDQEIALMKHLDVFVSHDSSNMHMAAWSGRPVVSIWGGTHPGAGFAPYANENNIVSLPEGTLDCQPCSIFGTSTCKRGDFACMQDLAVNRVATKVNSLL